MKAKVLLPLRPTLHGLCLLAALLGLFVSAGCASFAAGHGGTRDDPGTPGHDAASGIVRVADSGTYSLGGGLRIAALAGPATGSIPGEVWAALRPDASAHPIRSQKVAHVDGANFYIAVTPAGLVCIDVEIPAQSQGTAIVGGAGCASQSAGLSTGIFVYSGDLDLAAILVPDGYDVETQHGREERVGNNIAIIRGDGAHVVMSEQAGAPDDVNSRSISVAIPSSQPPNQTQIRITRTGK